jgi:hypothetical protein
MPALHVRTTPAASGTNLTGLNATTGLTIAFWHRKRQGGTGAMDVFRQQNSATGARDGYYIGFSATELQLRIYGSAGATTSFINQQISRQQVGQWKHFAVTFDDASNVVLWYVNGMLVSRGTNTRDMTAVAGCTTTLGGASVNGLSNYALFDLQVFPDLVVPPSDISLLLNPRIAYPGCRGRYAGLRFSDPGAGGLVVDESGSGNDLTAGGSGTTLMDAEPPFRPTYT